VSPSAGLEWGWKISPPQGFYPQTIQPVASHYNDYAILAHKQRKKKE